MLLWTALQRIAGQAHVLSGKVCARTFFKLLAEYLIWRCEPFIFGGVDPASIALF